MVKSSVLRVTTCAAVLLFAGVTQAATAAVSHTVSRGESLWSIARRDGLSLSQLALANRVSASTHLLAGRVLVIPGAGAAGHGLAASHRAVVARGPSASRRAVVDRDTVDRDRDVDAATTPRAGLAMRSHAGPAPLGGYTIRPGDTLTAIASHSRVSVVAIAY